MKRRARRIGPAAAAGASLLALTCGMHQVLTWPDVRGLATRHPQTSAFLERQRREVPPGAAEAVVRWSWVDYAEISDELKRAVVAAEDVDFSSHAGFSWSEIEASIRAALAGKRRLRGASTITQQLAKNLWLSPARNPLRKLKEALLTIQLERHLSKRRILELYLNVVEFGPGIFGAEAASRHYYRKPAGRLTIHEAASLAASLPRPSRWHPGSDSPGYRRYVAEIESRMERASSLLSRL